MFKYLGGFYKSIVMDLYDDICVMDEDPAKCVRVHNFVIGGEPQYSYPSEWFKDHPNQKPSLKVIPSSSNLLQQLDSTILARFGSDNIPGPTVVGFLYYHFIAKPATLTKNWTSFGIQIGVAGANVNLSNLLDIDPTEDVPDGLLTGPGMSDRQVKKYIVAICGVYRLAQIDRDDYRANVLAKINNQLSKMGPENVNMAISAEKYLSWKSDTSFVRIMAAIDMFLNEFPNHVYAPARNWTNVSRLKDCSVLASTQYICEFLGLDFDGLAKWILTEQSADQFKRITKEGEELEDARSYSMYMVELGLTYRCPYTVKANPALHFFCHTLGASAGLERSLNAKNFDNCDVFNIIYNAMLMYYVWAKYTETGKKFHEDEEDYQSDSEDVSKEPKTNDPDAWLKWIKEEKHPNVPRHVKRFVVTRWLKNTNTRKGTVGRKLFEMSKTFFN